MIFYPTRDNLFRRKILANLACLICGLDAETAIHILWHCSSAQDVWSEGRAKFQKRSFHGLDFLQVAEDMLSKCGIDEFQLFVGIARRIWLRRNVVIHEGTFLHPNDVV